MENTISTEICQKCGECCRKYPFVELSETDINALEQATKVRCDVFANPKGKAVEEYFLQFQANGDCYFLNDNRGSYACGVYEARPGLCRNYPSTAIQREVCDANREQCLSHESGQDRAAGPIGVRE